MINPKAQLAIQNIMSVSHSARTIAQRLGMKTKANNVSLSANEMSLQQDVATLTKQIDLLTEEVEQLRSQLVFQDDDDELLSEEQLVRMREVFEPSLNELNPATIASVYDEAYMRDCSRAIRMALCTSLLNNYDSRKLEPLPLWYNIVANHGSL